jgi:hypothetical protein
VPLDYFDSSNLENLRLRDLVDSYTHFVYEAVKAGKIGELTREGQLMAKAIQEHLDVPWIHNALEFADLREGQPFLIAGSDGPIDPFSHIYLHAAVLGMVEESCETREAFKALRTDGIAEHHAVHVLSGLVKEFLEHQDELSESNLRYAQKRICRDPNYRRQLAQAFPASHWEEK